MPNSLKKINPFWILGLFFVLSFILHLEYIPKEIRGNHAMRQCQTMWNVRNFARHDANILNSRVSHFNGGKENLFRMELPIMQWCIGMLHRVFGESLILVRCVLFLIGMIGIFGFYKLLLALNLGKMAALAGAFLLQFSPLFFTYTINPLPDILALSAGIWYLYFIFSFINSDQKKDLIKAAFALLIATFAKLPFAMFGIVSVVHFLYLLTQKGKLKTAIEVAAFHILLILPAMVWYAWVIPTWSGNGVLTGVFENEISSKKTWEYIYYHRDIMFPYIILTPIAVGLLVIGIIGFFKVLKTKYLKYIAGLVFIVFLYLTLEFNMIGSVHDYYMIPFLPVLYMIASIGIAALFSFNKKWINALVALGLLISPYFAMQLQKENVSPAKSNFNADLYKYQDQLKKVVPYADRCIILNDNTNFHFSYLIDKMGYVFAYDHLPAGWIKDMILNYDAKYMYSDSRKVDQDPEVQFYFEELTFDAESVKVYKLKSPEDLKLSTE